jgi:hypothetical protein
MESDISEFSYGYALTQEIVRLTGSSRCPVFPSLLAEAKLGFDVKIARRGKPLFLQFKLSQCMTTYRAEEAQKGLLTPPFYRFRIRSRKHSDQHALLCQLDRKYRSVYYAAPEFSKPHDLHDAYARGDVMGRSAFISPSDIGVLKTDGSHKVSFEVGTSIAYFLSEPVQLSTVRGRTLFLEKLPAQVHEQPRRVINRDFFKELSKELIDIYRSVSYPRLDHEELTPLGRSSQEPWEFAAFLSRSLFGTELYLAVEEPIGEG